MNRIKRLSTVLSLMAACLAGSLNAQTGLLKEQRYVAISLTQAHAALSKGGTEARDARSLGGITHPRALIHLPAQNELIIIGERDRRLEPLSLDEWAVALRSQFKAGVDPVVSIDQTEDTSATGMQTVRFEGQLEDTKFGADMLAADVVLKRLGLGLLEAQIFNVPSFLALTAEDHKHRQSSVDGLTRFWFVPKQGASHVYLRDGLVFVEEYKIDVQFQRHSDGTETPGIAGIFTEALSAHYDDLKVKYTEFARLEQLYFITALAQGLQQLGLPPTDPAIELWVNNFEVAHVETPAEFPLEKNSTQVTQDGGKLWEVSLSGGIDLETLVIELEDGDPDALRRYVLAARPQRDALTWDVPLAGLLLAYETDIDVNVVLPHDIAADQGMSLLQQTRALGGAPSIANSGPSNDTSRFANFDSSLQRISNTPQNFAPLRPVVGDVGGVLLDGVAQIEAPDGKAIGPRSGNFALIIEDLNSRLHPQALRRFATAIWATELGAVSPGISIDPIAPGEKKQLVRYIGHVKNTELAGVMREADYLMKKWSVGVARPNIRTYKSPEDYSFDLGTVTVDALSRFWFVPGELIFQKSGDAVLFDRGNMTLQTEFLGQYDSLPDVDPGNKKFAAWFTKNYAKIAEAYPVFEDLFEYSKLVSLAQFIKQSDVPLFWYIMAHRELVLPETSPGSLPSLFHDSKLFEGVRIEGGVNLTIAPEYILDDETMQAIADAAKNNPTQAGQSASLPELLEQHASLNLGALNKTIVPLHSRSSSVDTKGVRYQTDISLDFSGYRLTGEALEHFSAIVHSHLIWREIEKSAEGITRASPAFERAYREAWSAAVITSERLLGNLNQLRNRDFTTRVEFLKEAKRVLGADNDPYILPIIGDAAVYREQFDLVRFLAPGYKTESSEFGPGWRLLSPYRLEFGNETSVVNGLKLPSVVTVIDLLHGKRNAMNVEQDTTSGAIWYFPAANASTLETSIFMTVDGPLIMTDRLGNTFRFDGVGRLIEMAFSPSHKMKFEFAPISAFEKTPYVVAPVKDGGLVDVLDGAYVMPKWLRLSNAHGESYILEFDEQGGELLWKALDGTGDGKIAKIKLKNDFTFEFADAQRNEWHFDQNGEFTFMNPNPKSNMVAKLCLGEMSMEFLYELSEIGSARVKNILVFSDRNPDRLYFLLEYAYDPLGHLADVNVVPGEQAPDELSHRTEPYSVCT